MNQSVLIVEDEAHIADGLKINLEAEGYRVVVAEDGETALDLWRRDKVDLIVLDIMLPGRDGLDVCRTIRAEAGRVPVLFLTARDREDDRIAGLLAGGDDYMTKPFNLQELILRVNAILRRQVWYRQTPESGDSFSFGNNLVDFSSYRATGPHGEVELSQKECMIMKLLVERANQVVTRDRILDTVWGYNVYPTSRTVDNFIVKLRKIFEPDPSQPIYLHTIRGAGYKFTPAGGADE